MLASTSTGGGFGQGVQQQCQVGCKEGGGSPILHYLWVVPPLDHWSLDRLSSLENHLTTENGAKADLRLVLPVLELYPTV